ncbi:MAG: hypothetical protein P8X66_06785 [Maritimibacter sp.]|jgi:hypothetical protein
MSRFSRLFRLSFALLAGAVALAACAKVDDLTTPPPPLGRFLLGHNIALVADGVQVGPMSRTLEDDVIIQSVRKAINEKFSRYDGDQYYHIASVVMGYVLAAPGIPLVASPKSVLIANVTIYDDRNGGKPINEEPKQFTILESPGNPGDVLLGTGFTRSAEEQMDSLALGLADEVRQWLLENPEWFGDASLMDPATTSAMRPIQPLPPVSKPAGEGADASAEGTADNMGTTNAPEA